MEILAHSINDLDSFSFIIQNYSIHDQYLVTLLLFLSLFALAFLLYTMWIYLIF